MLNIKEFKSKVVKVKRETPTIKSFQFSVPEDFTFKPGQHIALGLNVNGKLQLKSFSISSSPLCKEYIETAKRITNSDYSQTMNSLKLGDVVLIKGPYGLFVLDETKDAIMIAGGVGITPFKCMIEYATSKLPNLNITLFFSNKTLEDVPFKEELSLLQKKNKNLKIVYTFTRVDDSKFSEIKVKLNKTNQTFLEKGRISSGMIKKYVYDLKLNNKVFYVSGSPEMVNSIVELLSNLNIPQKQIKAERFTGLK